MTARADDYRWIRHWRGWDQGYCLTVVKHLSPDDVLDRLHASGVVEHLTLDQVEQHCWAAWEHDGRALFVGVTSTAAATVMVETNGYVGVTEALAGPVSRGTELVSHYKNVNAVDRFLWIVDEAVRLEFEPLFPSHRSGPAAADVELLMRQVGFDFDDSDNAPSAATPAAFALAEELTGLRVTTSLLTSARYVGGLIQLPPPS